MTGTEVFEEAAVVAIAEEVEAARPSALIRGVQLGDLEVWRDTDGAYWSEVRLYAYRDGNLCDALEHFLWWKGSPAGTIEELRAWFREQLPTLGIEP